MAGPDDVPAERWRSDPSGLTCWNIRWPGRNRRKSVGPVGERWSAVNGRTEIPQRELGSRLSSTLRAVLDVAPTPQESRALRIEKHDKRLGERVDLDPVARLPLCRGRAAAKVGALDHPAESGIVHIHDPGAVAGLNDYRIHGTSIPRIDEIQTAISCRLSDSCPAEELLQGSFWNCIRGHPA
jgi:hypothetical protein